jgi:hypothetical protein
MRLDSIRPQILTAVLTPEITPHEFRLHPQILGAHDLYHLGEAAHERYKDSTDNFLVTV